MDIFFLVPNNHGTIFLYNHNNTVYQCQVYFNNPGSRLVDLISFPITNNENFQRVDEEHMERLSSTLLDFFKTKKSETKLGSYLKDCPELYKFVLKNPKFFHVDNKVTAIFNIHNNSFIFESMSVLKDKEGIMLIPGNDAFLHNTESCGCIKIKKRNNILISSCLFCLEHDELILAWLTKEYEKEFSDKNTNNIVKFIPKNNI